MDFVKGMLKSNGIGALETVSTLASGGSIADSGMKLAKRVLAKKFEGVLMESADSYVAGYKTNIRAALGAAGISAGVGVSAWGVMKAWEHFSGPDEDETIETIDDESSNTLPVGALAGIAGFVMFAVAFLTINTVRRQRTLSTLAGENMVNQYVKFFSVPFAIFFVLFRVIIPSDVFKIHHVAIFAAGFAGAVLSIVKKFYFVYKINDLEKDLFSNLATIFDACKDMSSSKCDHEHAGFVDVFKKARQANGVMTRDIQRIWGKIDYAEMARELSKSQIFDNAVIFTG